MVRLKDVGKIITGNTPKTSEKENYESHDICFVKPSDIENDKISYIEETENFIAECAREKARILPVNSVLVTCIGIIGKIAINKVECAFNQQINAIIPNEKICLAQYLAYAIKSKKILLQNMANAPVVPILNKTQFADVEIKIVDLKEQECIVEKLSQIEKVIIRRKQQLQKLDELVKARFVEMFGLSTMPRYNKVQIGTVARLQGGFAFKSSDFVDDGIALVQIANVNKNYLNWEVVNKVPGYYKEKYSAFLLEEGDLLLAMTRPVIKSLNAVKVAKVSKSDLPCLLNQRVGRFVCTNMLNPIYLEMVCKTDDFKDYIEKMSGNSLQPNVSSKQVESYEFVLPPIEIQNQFANFVVQINKSKLHVQKSLEKLEMLKKSLMQKYFG